MNLIKSFFIFVSPLVLLFIVIQAIGGLYYSSNTVLYFGLLFSAVPLLLFLIYVLIFKNIARTSIHLPIVSVPSFLGYCLVLYVFIKASKIEYIDAMVYSLMAFFITFLYVYWYSNNARKLSQKLNNTELLANFELKDLEGKKVSSENFFGEKVLIFFFRGNWCPLCMAQINEVANSYQKFEDNSIRVVFISPQPSHKTESLAKRFNLAFEFYIDESNAAAKQLGIFHKNGLPMGLQALGYETDTVYPTVIALNTKSEIIYNNQTSNYRIRPEPDAFLALFI
ncbi:MAG: peroxiredoxin family protein [Marinicellaceae bacterium]